MTRVEEILKAIVNGETTNIKPHNRMEKYLLALLNGETDVPEPKHVNEAYLYQLCKQGVPGGGDESKETCTLTISSGDEDIRGLSYLYKSPNGFEIISEATIDEPITLFDVCINSPICIHYTCTLDGTAYLLDDSRGLEDVEILGYEIDYEILMIQCNEANKDVAITLYSYVDDPFGPGGWGGFE